MRKLFLLPALLFFAGVILAQNYPTPEFSNEICLLKKDSAKLMRLEKGSSRMEAKSKMMGFGGMENGYTLDGEKSTVRISKGNNLSFIFTSGGSSSSNLSPEADSAMKASGMEQAMQNSPMSMLSDPSQNTTLYNMNIDKGKRKITLQSASGMGILGKTKKISTKYTLSIKKVKEGYYEMIVDKTLPKGEYAFVMMSFGSMDGSSSLFAFGVD